jgi:plastocyanin
MRLHLPLIAAAALALPVSAQTTHTVTVGPSLQNSFSPQDITIQVGDKVNWVWDTGRHNVVSDDGYFTSGALASPPHSFSMVFDAAFLASAPISGNRYAYQCALHGFMGMVGSVTVETPGIPVLNVTDPVPGGQVTIKATGVTPGANVIYAYSLNGAGPVNTPFGAALLSPPINQLPPDSANGAGVATMSLTVPANIPVGKKIWLQCVDLGAGILTNGVRVIV